MPLVGKDKPVFMGDVSKDSMYGYARKFHEVQENLIKENQIDFGLEPVRALLVPGNREALKEFFVEDCMIGGETRDGRKFDFNHEQVEDEKAMMEQAFNNDIQAIRESAVAGLATFNPMVGLSLPMHKYLMMNCVFAQALPRFVAKSPMWTESIESRFMVNPDGTKIDLAQEQNKIYKMLQIFTRKVIEPFSYFFLCEICNHILARIDCINAVNINIGNIFLCWIFFPSNWLNNLVFWICKFN